jgi:hypothetical protein
MIRRIEEDLTDVEIARASLDPSTCRLDRLHGSLASSAPDASLATVLKLFPGYHVLNLNERDGDVRADFQQDFPGSNPSISNAGRSRDGNANPCRGAENSDR